MTAGPWTPWAGFVLSSLRGPCAATLPGPLLNVLSPPGGFAIQNRDSTCPGEVRGGKAVTRRSPTDDEPAPEFAWCVCKHVRSNAIVLSRAGKEGGLLETVAIDGGQAARVTAVPTACEKAAADTRGSVLASDVFFPSRRLEAAVAGRHCRRSAGRQ